MVTLGIVKTVVWISNLTVTMPDETTVTTEHGSAFPRRSIADRAFCSAKRFRLLVKGVFWTLLEIGFSYHKEGSRNLRGTLNGRC